MSSQCNCKLEMSATMKILFFPLYFQSLKNYYRLVQDCGLVFHFKQQAVPVNNDVIQPKDGLTLSSEYELEILKQIDWSVLSYKVLRDINNSIVLKAEYVLGEKHNSKTSCLSRTESFPHTSFVLTKNLRYLGANSKYVQEAEEIYL